MRKFFDWISESIDFLIDEKFCPFLLGGEYM